MAERDIIKYQIKDGNEIVYYGITNDLERREQEHRSEGMDFTSIEKIGNVTTRDAASNDCRHAPRQSFFYKRCLIYFIV